MKPARTTESSTPNRPLHPQPQVRRDLTARRTTEKLVTESGGENGAGRKTPGNARLTNRRGQRTALAERGGFEPPMPGLPT